MRKLLIRGCSGIASSRSDLLGKNIFAEFSKLAAEYDAVNLGQGFPNFGTPDFVRKAGADAILSDNNQYTRPGGHPEVVDILAKMYSKLYNRKIDGMSEIVTFNGGQEGIVSIFGALLNPGDRVAVIEPYFDAYVNAAKLFDLKTVGVPLTFSKDRQIDFENGDGKFYASELKLDMNQLNDSITSETKMLVLNTPHNPTGKVFLKDELEQIVEIIQKHPHLIVLSDEVYEFMCFDGLKHERIATFPDMFDRVISLFSAGKTFSCTGWRVGYGIMHKKFAAPILKVHNAIPFCGSTPLEYATGKAFELAQKNGYLAKLPEKLQKNRDTMVDCLNNSKLTPIIPQGGYFVCCDTSKLAVHSNLTVPYDYSMAMELVEHYKLATIPTSPFYSSTNQHLAKSTIRISYCKDNATLSQAKDAISKL